MSEQEPDLFTETLTAAYSLMKAKGHWMVSGIIELKNGTKFSYKIKEVK